MSPNITYAPSVEEDFERIGNKLSAYTLEQGAPAYNPLSKTFTVAAENGDVLGEAIITQNWGEVEINLLHVESDQRGKGVGSQLISSIENFAQTVKATAITLSSPTWQAGTRPGEKGFYEKCGFEAMGRIPLKPDNQGNPHEKVFYLKVLEGNDNALSPSSEP